MKFKISFLLAQFVLIAVLIFGCKKEEPVVDDGLVAEYVPEWLIPYVGVYSGSFDGDDEGTWTCSIDRIYFMFHFVSSADSSQSWYTVEITDSLSFSNYAGGPWIASGRISETGQVIGDWQNMMYNTQGEFSGSKIQ